MITFPSAVEALRLYEQLLLIRAYEIAEASAIQPFAYLQLAWVSALGLTLFGDTLRPNVALGTVVVVCAGLFTLWRARQSLASRP